MADTSEQKTEGYRPLFISASDGLNLHVRDYGPLASPATPVVCLPGLARTSYDFHDLGLALSRDAKTPRRVLAIDYRGRGLSARDPDPANYDVPTEVGDLLQVLAATGVHEAIFVGTSRGGLITMALGAARPAAIKGVVMNDVGPVIDPKGLIRIRGYIGKLPKPRNYAEAVEILKTTSDRQFPALTDESWMKLARGTWVSKDGKLEPAYDPALSKGLEALDFEQPLPPLWGLFEALAHAPVLALRGEHSDILSAETLREMAKRHPRFESMTVPGQGHAPLIEGDVIQRIRAFLDGSEAPAADLRLPQAKAFGGAGG
jgi:pimeloyl-ACP methyl ester carboxylesterase